MAEVALRDYLTEIDRLIEHNSYDTAIHHCRHILGHYPKYVEAYRLLGKALLEKEDDEAAADVFQRVLGVDPEDFVARVGLSIIFDRRNELDRAIWHMERAFDLAPSNEVIQSELRRLYGRRDGVEPERISLTRSALARMYAQGDLYAEAITDLRQLLQDQPDRIDLQVLFTEVLWRDEQRVEAADWASRITVRLPYCLNANLILGEIWRASGMNGDGEVPFKRAQAVDPDNAHAARLFGPDTPLPPQTATVPHLEMPSYGQIAETGSAEEVPEEVPDWLRGLAGLNTPMVEASAAVTTLPPPAGAHLPATEAPKAEIPDWLQGLAVPTEEAAMGEVPDWLVALGTGPLESSAPTAAPEGAPPALPIDQEVPDWIRQLGTGVFDQGAAPPTEPAVEETLDQPKQPGTGALSQAPGAPEAEAQPSSEEVPDWLRQLSTGTSGLMPSTAETTIASPTEVPDWLQRPVTGPLEQPAAGTAQPAEPDWLAQLRASTPPLEEYESSDWLAQLQASTPPIESIEPPPVVERKIEVDTDRTTVERLVKAFERPEEPAAEAAPAAEIGAPPEMLNPDDALAFLSRLAAGKEEQLRAAAEAEGAARMASIMGRKPVEPAQPIEPSQPLVEAAPPIEAARVSEPPAVEVPPVKEVVEPSAEMPDWLKAMQPEAEIAEASMLEEAPSEEALEVTPIGELPDWLKAMQPQATHESLLEETAALPGESIEATPSSELPDWLKALRPQAEGEPLVAETAAPLGTAIEATPISELPDWLYVMQPAAEEAPLIEGRAVASIEMLEGEEPLAYLQRVADQKAAQLSGVVPPAGVAAAPVTPEPVPVVEAAPAPAAITVPEEMPSPEDALAFLAKLSAGKEEELRKQAEAEAAVRMDEIMVRKKTGPLYVSKPAPSVPEAKPATPEREAIKAGPEPIKPAPKPIEPVPEPKPIVSEVTARPAAAAPIETPIAATELPQPSAPPTEAAPAAPASSLPSSWWMQTAYETDEEPLAEPPPPMRMPQVAVAAPAAPAAPRPKRERTPRTARPKREEKRPAAPAPRMPPPAVAKVNIDPLVAHLESNAQDHAVRLELARAWWSMGNRDSALAEYTRLVPATRLSDEIAADLERIIEIDEHADWSRLLGDLYMKKGKLVQALDMYRRALSQL